MKRVLTIAGSDSGGGAGIQADLKTITLLGCYGTSIITALTAQNTCSVDAIYPVSPDFVEKQLDAVLSDIGTDATKTGMLDSPEIVHVVSQKIQHYKISNLVVDPVMVSKSGHRLLRAEAEKALIEELLPLALIATPNLPETEVITGKKVTSVEEMEEAAEIISKLGCKYVLIKGGHLETDNLVDVLFDGSDIYHFESKRYDTENTHGTGCTYSAAIATFLARGCEVLEAIAKAKKFIDQAIHFSIPLGKGKGPTNPYQAVARDWERYRVIQSLKKAKNMLQETEKITHLFPEVQSNLVYSLSMPSIHEDVAAFPGRFVRVGERFITVKDPEFGSSRHMANVVLTATRFRSDMRSAMNIRYDEYIVRKCLELGFTVAKFDRKNEPATLKEKEGSTLSWGVAEAIKHSNTFPDIIYDVGEVGKEPMIRVLGTTPEEVAAKVIQISRAIL